MQDGGDGGVVASDRGCAELAPRRQRAEVTGHAQMCSISTGRERDAMNLPAGNDRGACCSHAEDWQTVARGHGERSHLPCEQYGPE